MNREVVELIALSSVGDGDGAQEVVIRGLVFPVYLKSLSLTHWPEASISQSLFFESKNPSELIDYDLLRQSDDRTRKRQSPSCREILLKFCAKFCVPCVEIGQNGSIQKMHWWSPEFCSHVLPLVCVSFTAATGVAQFIYHNRPGALQSLRLFNLFPNQSCAPTSEEFKFVVFQLCKLYGTFYEKSFFPLLSLDNVLVDENLWVNVALDRLSEETCLERVSQEESKPQDDVGPFNLAVLDEVTRAWCQRKLSNFDYLLKLNEFAGRKKHDRSRHPVFPWVADFSSPDEGYRPLNRTKYRLTKGDAQLTMQYSKQKPCYHVPELLSDICYTVYRARVESKETLSKFVRAQWVPEEYPNSIARLYQWTPDECIPEFFDDPDIFKSIHPDMCDLQLPAFAPTPEEFIKWHRAVLESDAVSAHLHQWIDLTFGYQLRGKAAVNALNVHLSFVQAHVTEKFSGPVQLFTEPHPRRLLTNSVLDDPCVDGFLTTNSEQDLSVVTRDWNPDAPLSDLVSRILSLKQETCLFAVRSLTSLAVTILELALPLYCRNFAANISFDQRRKRAKELVENHANELPPYLQKSLSDIVSGQQLGQYVHEVLSDAENVFFLPTNMVKVHDLLCRFYRYDHLLGMTLRNLSEDCGRQLLDDKVETLWNCFEVPQMKSLWLNLFVRLLQHKSNAVMVCYKLLPRLSRFYTRHELTSITAEVIRVFDVATPNVIKLLDNHFLLPVSMAWGAAEFLEHFVPRILEMIMTAQDNLFRAVKEIILWISRRYGPVLTAVSITSKLLRLLPLCFSDQNLRTSINGFSSLSCEVRGDKQCQNILNCLIEIAVMFGPVFVTTQYLPFCADMFEQVTGRSTVLPAWESAMIAAVVLLRTIVSCLTDKQLLDQLEDVVVGKVLFASIRLFSSASLTFSNNDARKILAYKTMYTLHAIADRIGAENVKRHMGFAIQRLFSTFSVIYDVDEGGAIRNALDSSKQLNEIFSANFALLLLHIFSFTCGRQYTFSIIQNADLILKLETAAEEKPQLPELTQRRLEEMAFASSPVPSSLSGNRLFIAGSESSNSLSCAPETASSDSGCMWAARINDDSPTHLFGNWVDHFRAVLTCTSPLIPFDQIQLSTFSGHNAAVRKIVVLDNENSFVSASLDKTVKLWSLKNLCEVITPQLSYDRHAKSILDVVMLQSEAKIASTDGVVQIWDPFCDKTLKKLCWQDAGSDVAVHGLACLGAHSIVLSSQLSTMLYLYDVRQRSWANRISVCPPSEACQGVRTAVLSPNQLLLACALANGCISVLDVASGRMLGFNGAVDAEVTQIEWLTEESFVAIYTDSCSRIFELTPQLRVVGRLNESASIVYAPSAREYLTVHSGTKFRFYADGDFRHEVKLRSDFISGSSITAVGFMNLNKVFLVGSNSGMIRLAC